MMNQVILVGRIASDFTSGKVAGKECSQIKLAVPRSYKNEEGVYETDIIPVLLFGAVATNTAEYCKKGDIVGIKGAIRMEQYQGKTSMYLHADKITFLSSKAPSTDDEEEDE